MDYADFRKVWDAALENSGLVWEKAFPEEQIDAHSMDRIYKMVLLQRHRASVPYPFYITVELNWCWDALLSARFATTEEDLLTELFDRKHPEHTELPLLHIDIRLRAGVQGDGFYPLPGKAAWRDWSAQVTSLVAPHFPLVASDDPEKPAVFSWLGEPEIKVSCSSSGQLYLLGVSLSAWQLIHLPRQWDDPQRRRDPSPDEQINELLSRVDQGLEDWQDALDELVTARRDG